MKLTSVTNFFKNCTKIPQNGFTLPELLLVIGIIGLLFGTVTINLSLADQASSISTKISVLETDLKNQQIKAMTGDTGAAGAITDHGIYFENNRYTIFRGSTYSAGNATNFVVELGSNLTFENITFPNSQIIYSGLSGEISGYNASSDTIRIRSIHSSETKTLELNKVGTIISAT